VPLLSTRRSLALPAVVVLAICFTSCSDRKTIVFALAHVTVIDGTGAAPQSDSTVIVSDGLISAVGPASTISIPPNAAIVDGKGGFLIPGLTDSHIHLTGSGEPTGSREFILPLLVANGITTVRDMGGRIDFLKGLRSEIDSRKRLGPRIFLTGPYLDGDSPAF